jgi:hypothetical protein
MFYHVALHVWFTNTAVRVIKIGNIDVASMVVIWAIKCIIFSLCEVPVSKGKGKGKM